MYITYAGSCFFFFLAGSAASYRRPHRELGSFSLFPFFSPLALPSAAVPNRAGHCQRGGFSAHGGTAQRAHGESCRCGCTAPPSATTATTAAATCRRPSLPPRSRPSLGGPAATRRTAGRAAAGGGGTRPPHRGTCRGLAPLARACPSPTPQSTIAAAAAAPPFPQLCRPHQRRQAHPLVGVVATRVPSSASSLGNPATAAAAARGLLRPPPSPPASKRRSPNGFSENRSPLHPLERSQGRKHENFHKRGRAPKTALCPLPLKRLAPMWKFHRHPREHPSPKSCHRHPHRSEPHTFVRAARCV